MTNHRVPLCWRQAAGHPREIVDLLCPDLAIPCAGARPRAIHGGRLRRRPGAVVIATTEALQAECAITVDLLRRPPGRVLGPAPTYGRDC